MSEEKYQGYTNYETFLVDTYLANNKESYNRIQFIWKHPIDAFKFIDTLKLYVQQITEDNVDNAFVNSLVTAALERVDWKELVDLWITRCK